MKRKTKYLLSILIAIIALMPFIVFALIALTYYNIQFG